MSNPMTREGRKTLASEMRHYVTIQTLTRAGDGEGGFTTTWTDGDTIPAAIYAIQARQQFEYNTINVHATHRMKIRGLITVSEKTNRIKWGTRYFEILTVEDIQERTAEKIITCNEIRA